MKTLAKNHVFNHSVIGAKTFKNMLIGLFGRGKLPGLSRETDPFLESPGNLSGQISIFLSGFSPITQ